MQQVTIPAPTSSASEPWTRLSSLARLAPSPHNTQPYRLRPVSNSVADIVLLPDRLLPAEDRGNRYVYAALGIFAEAVELAARSLGRPCRVTPAAYPGVLDVLAAPTVVARVSLGEPIGAEADAARRLLTTRRTSRLPYHARPVDAAVRKRLIELTEGHGHRLIIESDPKRVRALLAQNAWAIIDNLQITDDRHEIESWVRYGDGTPAHGDGLWQQPLGQPAWEMKLGFACPWAFRIPGLSHLAVERFVASMGGTQHVALLSGPFSEWRDLIAAGRLLMRLWLTMAGADVYMHPFGSTLTNPQHAARIGASFGDDDGWLIFRFGYSDPPPASPRLPSVVMS